jgi:hypothetical protein
MSEEDAICFASKRPNSGNSIARSLAVSLPTPGMLSEMAAVERVVSSFETASAIADSIRLTARSNASICDSTLARTTSWSTRRSRFVSAAIAAHPIVWSQALGASLYPSLHPSRSPGRHASRRTPQPFAQGPGPLSELVERLASVRFSRGSWMRPPSRSRPPVRANSEAPHVAKTVPSARRLAWTCC